MIILFQLRPRYHRSSCETALHCFNARRSTIRNNDHHARRRRNLAGDRESNKRLGACIRRCMIRAELLGRIYLRDPEPWSIFVTGRPPRATKHCALDLSPDTALRTDDGSWTLQDFADMLETSAELSLRELERQAVCPSLLIRHGGRGDE